MKGISTPTQDRLATSDVVGGRPGLPRTRGLRLGRGVWRGASLGLCGLWLALGAAIPAAAQDFGDARVDDQVWTVGVAESLTLPAATAATAYTLTFDAALPSGVSFDAATRVLAGELSAVMAAINMTYTAVPATTPPQFFFFNFTGVAAPTFSMVQADLDLGIGNRIGQSLPAGADGAQPLSYTLMSTEATPRTVLDAAPGLAYDAARNFLYGAPQLSFSQDFVHTVEDANGATDVQTFTITATADATAPDLSYTAPNAVTVGVALTLAPITAATDVLSYSLDSGTLPEGLALQSVTGVISGTPSTANTATAELTLGVSDKSGNSGSYALTFPAVAKGAQALNEFDYRPRLAAVGATLTFTAPTGNVGDLSFSSADAAICTVDSAGALTLVAEGNCVITATALETTNYNAGTASVTVIVLATADAAGTDVQGRFPDHMRADIVSALGKTAGSSFTDKEVAGLTELTFAGDLNQTGDDIRGLRFATGLTFLSLRNLDINPASEANSSLSHIAGLTQLIRLDMPFNQSTEYTSLKGLVNLEYLDISRTRTRDYADLEGLLENPGLGSGDTVDISTRSGDVVFSALPAILALQERGVRVITTDVFPIALGDTSAALEISSQEEHHYLLTISEPTEVEARVGEVPDDEVGHLELRRIGNPENLAVISTLGGDLTPPLNERVLESPLLGPGEYAFRFFGGGAYTYSLTVNAVEEGFEEGMELSSSQSAESVFTYTDSANADLVVTVVGQVNTALTFAEGAAAVVLPASLGDLGGASRADVSVDFLPVAAAVAALPAEYSFAGAEAADYTKVDINLDVRPVPAAAFGVRVCLPVTANLASLANPVLLHYTGGAWSPVAAASYDAANSRICAADFPQDNFSPFAVGGVLDFPDLAGMELRSDQAGQYDYSYTTSAGISVIVVGVVGREEGLELPGFASVILPESLGDVGGASVTVSTTFSAVAAAIDDIPQTYTNEELSDDDYTKVDIGLSVLPATVASFNVHVCLPVTRNLSSKVQPVLLHYTGGAWTPVEGALPDAANRRICAAGFSSDNFSPFAVGAGEERMGLNPDQRSDLLKRTVGAMSRSTAQTVVNIISSRLSAAPEDKAQAKVAGYTLQADSWRDNFARQFYADAKALGQKKDLQLGSALRASNFTLPLLDQGVTLWGAMGGMKFEGSPEDGPLTTDYDGEVFSVLFGVDGEVGEDRRLGVALGFSDGDLEYTGSAGAVSESGDIEQSMIGVYPYMSWHPATGLSLWALGGYGVGEYDISKQPLNGELDQADSADATQWMLALGGEQEIRLGSEWDDNWDAKVRIKGLWNVLELDDVVFESGDEVADFETNTWRWAVENEYGYRISLGDGASIRPYGLVGLRWDGGDATDDDELFVDASGGVAFKSSTGLALDVAFRAQLSQDDAEEYALSGTGSLSYDSGQDGRGLQLAVKRSMVGFSGFDALRSSWDAYDFSAPTADVSPSDVGARMETELGYAWALQPLHVMRPGVLQTYLRSTFQDADRRHAVGFNFRTSTLDLILEAAHHQPSSEPGLSSSSPVEARLKAHLRF